MAKFTTHDGKDNKGIRAEVNVMTGPGRIKQIIQEEGKRNAEIIFDPDNPNLKRKVSAYLDTTSEELWALVQAAFADQRDIEYRIESQRKRKVDRAIPFKELTATEDIVRILAAVDKVFSREAVTDPKDDPVEGRVSAIGQDADDSDESTSTGASLDPNRLLVALARARQEGMSEIVIDTLVGQALAHGADFNAVISAGFTGEEDTQTPTPRGRVAAQEEKPWVIFNSDGRPNVGAYMITHAATAEQFALDHLIEIYTKGTKGAKATVDVSDKMIAQASSLALQILEMADEVQVSVTSGRANRQKNSYGRALNVIIDAVAKRYLAPIGENEQAQSEWHEKVVTEASERLYGIMEVAHGRIPLSLDERASEGAPKAVEEASSEPVATPKPTVATKVESATPETPKASERVVSAAEALGGKVRVAEPKKETVEHTAGPGEDGFIAPNDAQIARLRALCERAGVMGQNEKISNWLEKSLGARAARKIPSVHLEAWLTKNEALDNETLAKEVASL